MHENFTNSPAPGNAMPDSNRKIPYTLARRLNVINTLPEILIVSLEACLDLDGMDCGAVFHIDQKSGGFSLISSLGLSPKVTQALTTLQPESREMLLIKTAEKVFTINQTYLGHQLPLEDEGLRMITGIPIRHDGVCIALLAVASRTIDGMAASAFNRIETLTEHIGGVIARVKAEEALRNSEERLQHALDAAHEGIWDANLETGKLFFSDRAFRLLGYTIEDSRLYAEPSDSLGHMSIKLLQAFINSIDADSIIHPDDRQTIFEQYDRLEQTGRVAYEARFMTKSGTYVWIEMTGKAVAADANGNLLRSVGTFSDISHRKEMEQKRKNLELEIIHMEEQTKLNISQSLHDDLGSFLSMIKLNLDALIKKQAAEKCRGACALMQDGSFHELREMMTEAVKKCRLISSNLYPLHVVPGNMDHFVQRLSDMINRSPRPIQFSHSIDKTLAVSGETFTQLLYIASESVTNAIKHSDCSIIEVKILKDDDRAVMTVSDNGIGMNSDELKSIQGCLGLKIMEYRASLMNWSIAINSSFNDGTSVLCTFR